MIIFKASDINHYTSDAFVDVYNRHLSYVSIRLSDDDGRTLDLNGRRFTETLKLAFVRSNKDESIPATVVAAAVERPPGGGGRSQPYQIIVFGASGRVAVEETENYWQDTDIDEVKLDLVAFSNLVIGFEDEFNDANIHTDNITVVGFDTDMSVGASLFPTTVPVVGPIHLLVSETHERKTVHAKEVLLARMSLSNTSGSLRGDIDAIEDLNLVQHLKVEGTELIGVDQSKRNFRTLEYPWRTIYTTEITVNDIINANMLKSSRSDTDNITVYAKFRPNDTKARDHPSMHRRSINITR
jgi:hypothetical protein